MDNYYLLMNWDTQIHLQIRSQLKSELFKINKLHVEFMCKRKGKRGARLEVEEMGRNIDLLY